MYEASASGNVFEQVQTLFTAGSSVGVSDRDLLERFLYCGRESSDAAFAALVERHGPMVLRVCRQSLVDAHAAEDAFQATFLVLAQRRGRFADAILWKVGSSVLPPGRRRTSV